MRNYTAIVLTLQIAVEACSAVSERIIAEDVTMSERDKTALSFLEDSKAGITEAAMMLSSQINTSEIRDRFLKSEKEADFEDIVANFYKDIKL